MCEKSALFTKYLFGAADFDTLTYCYQYVAPKIVLAALDSAEGRSPLTKPTPRPEQAVKGAPCALCTTLDGLIWLWYACTPLQEVEGIERSC